MTLSVNVALRVEALLGEAPLWDSATNRLLWVDILGKSVGQFDPVTGINQNLSLPTWVSAVVPAQSGGLLVAVHAGIAHLDPVRGTLSDPMIPSGHDPSAARFNDGRCDAAGRFVAGTMSLSGEAGAGSLYSFSRNGSVQTLLRGVSMSNGIGWSIDGTRMYYVDTPTREIAVFDYDVDTGTLANRRTTLAVPESLGFPDGLTVDAEGMIWLALWGGSAITRWDPHTGRLLGRQTFPASQITSCAFGGANLDTLFVTSARYGLSSAELAREPLAGSIFALDPNVRGIPAGRFGA